MSNLIKFIYFDVGGVLLLDFSKTNKWKEMISDMGVKHEEFVKVWKKYEDKVCIDQDVDELIETFVRKYEVEFSNNYSLLDEFVSRFDKNPSIWSVVEYARKQYKVGILSNQYPRMLDLIKKRNLLEKISWDVVIDSSVVGMCKPDQGIYKLAQKKAGVEPEEILFVENSQMHIDVAKKLGWQTFLYDPSDAKASSEKLQKVLQS